ncbi:MAG: DMT family transporter [Byssovorax sp.]
MEEPSGSTRRGAWLAVLSAVCFGVTAPLVKIAGHGAGPFATAALLYLGAATFSVFGSWAAKDEAPLRAGHLPRLVAVASLGAVLAPALLAWGLQRTSATSASLLLNLEAVFTIVLGRMFYEEPIGRQVALAVALVTGGSMLVVAGGSGVESMSLLGAGAVAAATLGWALDNTLTRPLSDLDPRRVVLAKAGIGSVLSGCVALLLGETLPAMPAALALLGLGGIGYGLSLRLYLLAQRRIGAGRTGSIFALGPFLGIAVAWATGERAPGLWMIVPGSMVALGVYAHVTERHRHRHHHERMEHEHAHRHDDGHHDHAHAQPIIGEHSHLHRHEPMAHEHAHGSDLHHQHRHDRSTRP